MCSGNQPDRELGGQERVGGPSGRQKLCSRVGGTPCSHRERNIQNSGVLRGVEKHE